jgi:RHS repeat-associated protein
VFITLRYHTQTKKQNTLLLNLLKPLAPPIPGTKYQYDLAGRLITEEIPASMTGGVGKTVAYSYDKAGNRQTRTETPLGGTAVTTSYTYDDNDRLLTETKGADLISSVYDANGNLTSETHKTNNIVTKTIARAFTFEGKITKEETFVGVVRSKETVYNYDGEGNRIGVTRTDNNGGWTKNEYLVDTSQPYAEVIQETETHSVVGGTTLDPNGLLFRYDIGLDRLRVNRYSIQANVPNTLLATAWYVFDGLGSTRALVDNAGVVGADGAFGYEDAFGKPYNLANVGQSLTGFFLNGQQWDGSEGLYFNRARYYQPQTGRFIGQDPYAGSEYEPNTLHRYLYTANDPVNSIDPSGNEGLVAKLVSLGIKTTLTTRVANIALQVFNCANTLATIHNMYSDFVLTGSVSAWDVTSLLIDAISYAGNAFKLLKNSAFLARRSDFLFDLAKWDPNWHMPEFVMGIPQDFVEFVERKARLLNVEIVWGEEAARAIGQVEKAGEQLFGLFNPNTMNIYVHPNAPTYTVWHELLHALHMNVVGKVAYKNISVLSKEMLVYRRMMKDTEVPKWYQDRLILQMYNYAEDE